MANRYDKPLIYATRESRAKLKDRFNVNQSVVSCALRFKGMSSLQRRIRAYAVNYLQCPLINFKD